MLNQSKHTKDPEMKNKNKDQTSQHKSSLKPLNDFKQNGKKRPWNKNKSYSVAVSKAHCCVSGLEHYGEKIAGCGNYLKFGACKTVEHGKKLKEAYFCRCRGCVMCQWRKSLLVRNQVMDLVKEHWKEYSTDVPLFMSLTVVNEKGEDINRILNQMNAAWKRLMELKVVKRVTRSWFKSLEITYNSDRDDFHPHFHALVMVPHNYFYRKSGLYITHDEWLRLWQKCMRDERITQVDIRKVKKGKKGDLESIVGEVAKYATKPGSYIFKNEEGKNEANPDVVKHLYYGLRGRRLIGFGGYFNKIRKVKKMVDVEKADLVDAEGDGVSDKCSCKICKEELVDQVFNWDGKSDQYWMSCSEKETSEGEVESSLETEIQEKPKVQKIKRRSILLGALRKSLRNTKENEDSDRYRSDGERVQCRGPT